MYEALHYSLTNCDQWVWLFAGDTKLNAEAVWSALQKAGASHDPADTNAEPGHFSIRGTAAKWFASLKKYCVWLEKQRGRASLSMRPPSGGASWARSPCDCP